MEIQKRCPPENGIEQSDCASRLIQLIRLSSWRLDGDVPGTAGRKLEPVHKYAFAFVARIESQQTIPADRWEGFFALFVCEWFERVYVGEFRPE